MCGIEKLKNSLPHRRYGDDFSFNMKNIKKLKYLNCLYFFVDVTVVELIYFTTMAF